jgi:hypothetical protein
LQGVTVNAPGVYVLNPPAPPIPPVPITSTNETVTFFNNDFGGSGQGLGGGLLDNNLNGPPYSLNINFWGALLFSTFAPAGGGNYTAAFTNGASGVASGFDQNPNDNPVTFDYSIAAYTTPPPPGAAPEPSSLILLGTGALGVLGSFRRRLFA